MVQFLAFGQVSPAINSERLLSGLSNSYELAGVMSNSLFSHGKLARAPRNQFFVPSGDRGPLHLAVANFARELIRARTDRQVEGDHISFEQGLFGFHLTKGTVSRNV